jgi:hypothetical protein
MHLHPHPHPRLLLGDGRALVLKDRWGLSLSPPRFLFTHTPAYIQAGPEILRGTCDSLHFLLPKLLIPSPVIPIVQEAFHKGFEREKERGEKERASDNPKSTLCE